MDTYNIIVHEKFDAIAKLQEELKQHKAHYTEALIVAYENRVGFKRGENVKYKYPVITSNKVSDAPEWKEIVGTVKIEHLGYYAHEIYLYVVDGETHKSYHLYTTDRLEKINT